MESYVLYTWNISAQKMKKTMLHQKTFKSCTMKQVKCNLIITRLQIRNRWMFYLQVHVHEIWTVILLKMNPQRPLKDPQHQRNALMRVTLSARIKVLHVNKVLEPQVGGSSAEGSRSTGLVTSTQYMWEFWTMVALWMQKKVQTKWVTQLASW